MCLYIVCVCILSVGGIIQLQLAGQTDTYKFLAILAEILTKWRIYGEFFDFQIAKCHEAFLVQLLQQNKIPIAN